MNSYRYLIVLFALVLTGLAACEKPIELNAEVKEPKLVANSWFTADSTMKVHLSRSLSVIDDGDLENVGSGTVRVLDGNGSLIETLTAGSNGVYEGTFTPKVGQTYQVEASAPGYNSVSASDLLVQAVPITGIDTNRRTFEFDSELELKITIQDPPGENWYLLRVQTIHNDSSFVRPAYASGFYTSDPAFESAGDSDYYTWGTFRDRLFDGQEYTFPITLYSYDVSFQVGDLVEVELFTTSEAGYNFRRSIGLYQEANGNPFAQPVQVYSNVKDGFGCVAGYTSFVWPIQF